MGRDVRRSTFQVEGRTCKFQVLGQSLLHLSCLSSRNLETPLFQDDAMYHSHLQGVLTDNAEAGTWLAGSP